MVAHPADDVYVCDVPVDVELLVVSDCPNEQAVVGLLLTSLRDTGLAGTPIRVTVIDSQRTAEQRRFIGSPTVLIDGVDPLAQPERTPALACRVYPGSAGPTGLPPADRVRAALAHAAAGHHRGCHKPNGRPD